MKRLIAIAAILCACGVAMAGDWAAPISVNIDTNVYTPTKVVILGVNVRCPPPPSTNEATVHVQWAWLTADNKVVRTGIKKYSEADLDKIFASMGTSVEAMRALFVAAAKVEAEK